MEQEKSLERQQTQALKNIYGFHLSAAKLLKKSGLETLAERREKASLSFAIKCTKNPRFEHWFPKRKSSHRTRDRRPYVEMNARTERCRNSPLYAMRRQLNNHEKEGTLPADAYQWDLGVRCLSINCENDVNNLHVKLYVLRLQFCMKQQKKWHSVGDGVPFFSFFGRVRKYWDCGSGLCDDPFSLECCIIISGSFFFKRLHMSM